MLSMLGVGHTQTIISKSVVAEDGCNAVISSYNQPPNISKYIIVDKYGRGQYTSVQAAIDSVPKNNMQWVYIKINAAVYL